jgi:acyl carrier protein
VSVPGVERSASPDDLRSRVRGLFVERLHIDPPSDDADLVQAGLLDSLAFVDLVFHLEESLGLKLSVQDIDIEQFSSVAAIADFLASSRAEER